MTLRKISGERFEDPAARFCAGERLVIDGLRLWAASPDTVHYIERRFRLAIGIAGAERAIRGLKILASVLSLHAHRPVKLHRPGSLNVSADERAVIALLGTAARGHAKHGFALLTWLLPAHCRGTALAAATELGRALEIGGIGIAAPRGCMAFDRGLAPTAERLRLIA